MNRLFIKSQDNIQKTVDSLHLDLERRIMASPPVQCPTDLTLSFLKLCHSQSCGKCVPCRVGLSQLQCMLEDILDPAIASEMKTIDVLVETAESIKNTADCAIGFEAANMVLKGINAYREDLESHIERGICADSVKTQFTSVPCVAKCPADVDVPGYSALVKAGRYADAVRLIRKDNPFPTVCALICEHPCESRCRRNLVDAPVNIRGLKRFAVDNCGDVPVPENMESTGKKIAIIGGGPSGLTAAYFLTQMGHSCTVFEKRDKLGGMLRYGIPSYRLPRERLDWDIDAILSAGVEVKTGYDASTPEAIAEIGQYDAVYMAIGSHAAKSIGIEGEDAEGVIPAVTMLRGIGDADLPYFVGKRVAVIGGGNVAMDVARTAKRLGASEVSIVYRRRKDDMTALVEEIDAAIAENCNLIQLKAPARIEKDAEGKVAALWVKPQIAGLADKSGRPRPTPSSAPEERIECDIIIAAIGQATEVDVAESYGVPVYRGNITAGKGLEIKDKTGYYAGGDAVTGPATVIKAIAAGKVAAANIDQFLGFNHIIEVDIDIPAPTVDDNLPCGRAEMKERLPIERGDDFEECEIGLSLEEALQEAGRCLRCDYHGFGSFRGGRTTKW